MQEQNVVVSVREGGFKRAVSVLGDFGRVSRTEFYNVLKLSAEDVPLMLEDLRSRVEKAPESLSFLSRLIPASRTFTFNSPKEFERKAKEAVLTWAPELESRGFHVRIHRRGFKGRLSSPEEERYLDTILLAALLKAGHSGFITFENSDAVIDIETLGTWAGISLWSREDRERYPFIRVD
ncbi:MAG TPA: hypothetical protein DCO77_09550 [Nitrospiraceae bacterium]|nr:hypothetical protein [Nitrospiraceae bacterium]